MRVVYGGDVYRWILEHVESNEKKARQICQKMLEKEIIQNVDGRIDFNTVDLYRMYMHWYTLRKNAIRSRTLSSCRLTRSNSHAAFRYALY